MSETGRRLREAAEDLLLEKGQAETTLRDITERAGANVASVSYHFGSKDALFAEVFATVLNEATERQRSRFEALADAASLEEVVRVWLAPGLPGVPQDTREAKLWAIISRGMTERAPGLLQQTEAIGPLVEQHLIERLAACLPHLSREELMLRHAATLAATAALAGLDLGPLSPAIDPAAATDMIVTWIVGGLRAPAALVSPA